MQEKHRWAARPTTQARALTRSQTSDLSIDRLVLHPVSHTSQGSSFRIFLKKLFYWFSITVVCIYPTSLPKPSPPPSLASTRLGFVHVSFIVVPEKPYHLPPTIPSHLPSGYCQIALSFNVSGYILLACLFC